MGRRQHNSTPTAGRPVSFSPWSIFFSTSQLAGRKRTKLNYSFRVFSGLDDLRKNLEAEGMEKSEALNHEVAYAVEQVSEGLPYGPLFAFVAAKRGISVARTVMQLAIEQVVQQYPELAREMADSNKRK